MPSDQTAYVLPQQLQGNQDPVTNAPLPGLLLSGVAQVLAADNTIVRSTVPWQVLFNYGDGIEAVRRGVVEAFFATTADDPRVSTSAEVIVFLAGHKF